MTQAGKKIVKATKLSKLGKTVGILNTVLGVIPDTVEIVGKITDKTAPIVDKHLDRQHEYKKSLIPVPNLIDVEVHQAKEHLESLGLSVIPILAKPNKKYSRADIGEVVDMKPRSGKVRPGSLVKLYYVNDFILEASQEPISLPDVTGLSLSEAREILENLGYLVTGFPIKPRAKYADYASNQVVTMSPNPHLLPRPLRKGSLVRLVYLDQTGKEASQILNREKEAQKRAHAQTVKQQFDKIQHLLPKKKN